MTWTGTAGLSQTETSVFAERPSTGTTDNYNDKEKGKQNRQTSKRGAAMLEKMEPEGREE